MTSATGLSKKHGGPKFLYSAPINVMPTTGFMVVYLSSVWPKTYPAITTPVMLNMNPPGMTASLNTNHELPHSVKPEIKRLLYRKYSKLSCFCDSFVHVFIHILC